MVPHDQSVERITSKRLILRSFQSPGDIVMLTAAVRDLHTAFPGVFQTDVRTSAPELWDHNPYISQISDDDADAASIAMQYPLIHRSNELPYHFLHGYVKFLEDRLGISIPVTRFYGDIHLSDAEKQDRLSIAGTVAPRRYWIIVAGGKYDFTTKWWNPKSYQEVVDHFQGRIQFVQCGESSHYHPPLRNVVNLVGRTSLRDFVRLVHFAEGVVCPITLAMHLAAAVESPRGRDWLRPCVVVAGAREPAHWEAYPGHQFIGNVGSLPCCRTGACWRSRCQLIGDGDPKDHNDVCDQGVQISPELRIPRCMDLISAADVIRRIEWYLDPSDVDSTFPIPSPQEPVGSDARLPQPSVGSKRVLLRFPHGLGDAIQFLVVLQHLRKFRPDWRIEVVVGLGKDSALKAWCHRVWIAEYESPSHAQFDEVFELSWDECRQGYADSPSTKPSLCLKDVFQITPVTELLTYAMEVDQRAAVRAREYLRKVCGDRTLRDGRFPAVIVHYQGNTSTDRKNLAHALIRDVCDVVLSQNAVPIILDWDQRSPIPDGSTVFNASIDPGLWPSPNTGDAATIAALIGASTLMIGIDSGPLHVAGATTTRSIAVWTGHHPVHFFDLADNVLHFVPGDHLRRVCGGTAVQYFLEYYKHQVYKQLDVELPALVESVLSGEAFDTLSNRRFLMRLTATSYDERYYREHRDAGLDYLGFGDWQRQYARWMIQSLGLRGKRLLDVGCACGAIVRGLGEAGAIVQGIDVNEHMIQLGREQWPDMKPLLHVCDAINLHLFADGTWDAIHTAQVAEHWRPEYVPMILTELRRVVVPGGLIFCSLDTEELFARQGRQMDQEDPTHVCIRPLAWWHEQLRSTGWRVCSHEYDRFFRDHPESFLKRYDWDWFVARKR